MGMDRHGDYDGNIEVGEECWFGVSIAVQNSSGADIEDIVIKDNLAGDLLLYAYAPEGSGWIYVPQPTSKKDNEYTDGFITVECGLVRPVRHMSLLT